MSILKILEQEAYHAVLLVFATQELDWVSSSAASDPLLCAYLCCRLNLCGLHSPRSPCSPSSGQL